HAFEDQCVIGTVAHEGHLRWRDAVGEAQGLECLCLVTHAEPPRIQAQPLHAYACRERLVARQGKDREVLLQTEDRLTIADAVALQPAAMFAPPPCRAVRESAVEIEGQQGDVAEAEHTKLRRLLAIPRSYARKSG